MAIKYVGGEKFEVPEGTYTGESLRAYKKDAGAGTMPVVRRQDRDIAVEPDEEIEIEDGDQIVCPKPVEAA